MANVKIKDITEKVNPAGDDLLVIHNVSGDNTRSVKIESLKIGGSESLSITNPIVFDVNNKTEHQNIDANLTLELAVTGHLSTFTYKAYGFNIADTFNVTLGTSFPADMIADIDFETNKYNLLIVAWNGNKIVGWRLNVSEYDDTEVVDVTAPTLNAFVIENANPNRIYFSSSEVITATTFAGFAVSPSNVITAITINAGQLTGHYFTVTDNFLNVDTPTIAYTTGSDLADTADTPNALASFGTTSITNNVESVDAIAPTLDNFNISDSFPSRVYFDSSEIITATTFTGFALSPSNTITGITIASGLLTGHYFTVTTPFVFGNTPTLAYSGGSDLADTATSPNALATFGATAITNNVVEDSLYTSATLLSPTKITQDGDDFLADATGLTGVWNQAYSQLNQSVTLDTDFEFKFEVGQGSMIFLQNDTNTNYTSSEFGLFINPTIQLRALTSGASSVPNVPVTLSAGNTVRLRRISGTIEIHTSTDDVTFTLRHTFAGVNQSAYNIFVQLNSNSQSMLSPRFMNL